ncbi:hypothetical protein [Dietzia maris]|uniref:hypothetical protein n=1 Tax=Dietzia maris TaxID=37915 RepID=UPI0023301100|nr:hypothetical protein [Dietzia maris]
MKRVLLTYLSEAEYRNLTYGMERNTWGLPTELAASPKKFDHVFISSLIKPGGPRRPPSEWFEKTMSLTIAERTGPVTAAQSLLWPDEIAAGKVRYRTRFPVTHLATLEGITLGDPTLIPKQLSLEIRSQAISGGAPVIGVDDNVIDRLLGG